MPPSSRPGLHRRELLLGLSAWAVACGPTTVPRSEAGTHELVDQIRGVRRRSLLVVPPGLTDVVPMLVGLHDHGETPETMVDAGWGALCQAKGWVGLFPDYPKPDHGEDDTNLAHVLQRGVAMGGADPGRVFLVGHGTGGRRAYALAADHGGLVAAVVASGAVVRFASAGLPDPSGAPMAVLHVHGGQDAEVPLGGGMVGKEVAVAVVEGLRGWVARVGGPEEAAVDEIDGVVRHRWSGGQREVELRVDAAAGHERHPRLMAWAGEFLARQPRQG